MHDAVLEAPKVDLPSGRPGNEWPLRVHEDRGGHGQSPMSEVRGDLQLYTNCLGRERVFASQVLHILPIAGGAHQAGAQM